MTNYSESFAKCWSALQDYLQLDKKKLPPAAFLVWTALLFHAIPRTGLVCASRVNLSAWTGIVSKNTVARAIAELIEQGFLERIWQEDPRQPSLFRLLAAPAKATLNLDHLSSEGLQKILDQVIAELHRQMAHDNLFPPPAFPAAEER